MGNKSTITKSQERHVDECGYTSGYTTEKGNTYDENHQYKGQTDEHGTIYDSNYNVVGHYGDHGYIYDQNHRPVGYKDKNGVFYNQNHQRSDYMDLFKENSIDADDCTPYVSESDFSYKSTSQTHLEELSIDSNYISYHSEKLVSKEIVSVISLIIAAALSLFNIKFSITAEFVGCSIVQLMMLSFYDAPILEALVRKKLNDMPEPQRFHQIWSGLCAFDFLSVFGSSIYVILYAVINNNGGASPLIPVAFFSDLLTWNIVFHVIAHFGFRNKINI